MSEIKGFDDRAMHAVQSDQLIKQRTRELIDSIFNSASFSAISEVVATDEGDISVLDHNELDPIRLNEESDQAEIEAIEKLKGLKLLMKDVIIDEIKSDSRFSED